MSSKTRKLEFSGKDEDFGCFCEQFEAKMYTLKLLPVLLDKVVVIAKTDPEDSPAKKKREDRSRRQGSGHRMRR